MIIYILNYSYIYIYIGEVKRQIPEEILSTPGAQERLISSLYREILKYKYLQPRWENRKHMNSQLTERKKYE